MQISKTWDEIKDLILNRNLSLQYEYIQEDIERYILYIFESGIIYKCILTSGTNDFEDFENNYKNDSNKSIEPIYKQKIYNSNVEIELNETETTLLELDVEGKLEYMSCVFDRDDVDFILDLDGENILNINLENLKNIYDLEDNSDFIRVENNGKHITLKFNEPVYVYNNVKIKAMKTRTSKTKMKSIIVLYKERK